MKTFEKILNTTLISGLLLSPLSVYAMEKEENVYSNLNTDGSIYKTTVSNHLSWVDNGKVEDDSELLNILNLSGEETFDKKENKLTWNAAGNDIFYQGTTEKELPIKTHIKYYLNDEEKEVNDILGKEGRIKIQITFENTLRNIVKVNGRNSELYTPFVTTIGTMIDSNTNKNISINNGKIVGTGSRNMVIGIASPGLYESLGLEEFKKLNEITITYETTNFSLNSIYIISTPKLLEETDLTIFNKMDSLYNNMQELQKNMNLLESGAKELANGAGTLSNGSNELTAGIKNARDAVEKLRQGSASLDNGLTQIITSLNVAQKELSKVNIESSLKDLTTLKNQNTNTYLALIKKTGMDQTTLANTYKQYDLQNYKGTDEKLQALKSTYELGMLLQANNTAIDTTITTLKDLSTKLNTLLNTLNNALKSAQTGSTQINNGLNELKNGMNKLYNGATTLNKGTKTLQNGADQLSNGASALNKQGIQKLNHYVNTLKNYSDKTEALLELSENYKGFTSQNSNKINFISIVKSQKIVYKR